MNRDPQKHADWQRRSAKRAQQKKRQRALDSGTFNSMQASREKVFARKGRPTNRHAANTAKAKRRQLKRVSADRARENRERRRVLREMTGGVPVACERCDRAEAVDAHEKHQRSAGGSITDPDNITFLCRDCHDWVENNPADAFKSGWLIHSWDA